MSAAIYRRIDAVEELDLDGETLLLNERTFAVTKLNEVGGWVWRTIGDGMTVDQLAGKMSEVYAIDALSAGADLSRFLDRMVDIGLMTHER